VDEGAIASALAEIFDFRPLAIIDALGLRNPIFTPTAAYGHFGRQPQHVDAPGGGKMWLFGWERTDCADDLRSALGL
jgi:S-adenosylmethionine synthetase